MTNPIQTIRPSPFIPLSQAVIAAGMVYVSGQVGFKPGTMELVSANLEDQCRQTFANIDAVLLEAGSSRRKIVMCRAYLRDIQTDFAPFNQCYIAWLLDHRPARTTVGAQFGKSGILVEVDCVALA